MNERLRTPFDTGLSGSLVPEKLLLTKEPPIGDTLLPVFTLIVWSVCLGVGVLGFVLSYPRPHSVSNAPEPVIVQNLQVELKKEPLPTGHDDKPFDPAQLPPADIPVAPLAVAQPSPAIAFAVPVAAPVRVVPLSHATFTKPALPPARPPQVQTLTFGEGEGRQPAPEYPRRALKQHQEGVVGIQFIVGENGRVISAEATQPSPWPELNEAALNTVREKWQFPAGALRAYDIAIRFQIAN